MVNDQSGIIIQYLNCYFSEKTTFNVWVPYSLKGHMAILRELGCVKIVKIDEELFLRNCDRWHSTTLWEKPVGRNSLSVIHIRVKNSITYASSLPLCENNVLMFENRNGVLWVHPLLHRKNNPEPVFENVMEPRNWFRGIHSYRAGNRFLGSLKGLQIRALEEGGGGGSIPVHQICDIRKGWSIGV